MMKLTTYARGEQVFYPKTFYFLLTFNTFFYFTRYEIMKNNENAQ